MSSSSSTGAGNLS